MPYGWVGGLLNNTNILSPFIYRRTDSSRGSLSLLPLIAFKYINECGRLYGNRKRMRVLALDLRPTHDYAH